MADYIELENTSDDVKKLVKQELKFKTGNLYGAFHSVRRLILPQSIQ